MFLDNIGKISNTTENQFSIVLGGSAPSGYSNTKKIIKFTPSVKSNFDVTFVKYANVYHEKCRKKTIFRPILRNIGVGQTKNIIFIGDSLVSSGDASAKAYELLNEDGDFNINMLGSHGVGNKINSGHGSWSWGTWIDPSGEATPIYGQLNEFFHNGALDFKYFMQNSYPSLSGIDIAVISLGTNDVGQNGTDGEAFVSDKIDLAIENAKVFITALLADYPNIKIAIGLPSSGAYFSCGYTFYPDGFRAAVVKYGAKMVDTFDNGKWHPNVTCVYHGWYIDPANDYPYSTITDHNGNEYKVIRNFIHPSEMGYQHLGIGYYNKIRAFLSGVL